MTKVVLIWNDGRREEVQVEDWSVHDGVLRLRIDRWTVRSIPLTSIREWTWTR